VNELAGDVTSAPPSALRLVLGAGIALGVHLAALLVALQCEPMAPPLPLMVTEVDLTPVELPAAVPPAPLVEEPAATPIAAPSRPTPKATNRPASSNPPPAAAGNLHAAKDDAPTTSEPVRFALDANGAAYGFGVVAAGGSGGQRGSTGTPPLAASVPGSVLGGSERALRSFAVPPRLEESDPCRGFFPNAASVDRGEVTLRLVVSNQGRVERATVLVEEPAGQGFGRAAVLCLRQKRFLPAQDERGSPQAAEAAVALRFSR
jgi:protein TonB